MLSQLNAIHLERALRVANPSPRFAPIADRASWTRLSQRLGDGAVAALVVQAEEAAAEPIPPLTATRFLEFKREGLREGYEEPQNRRRALLSDLVLGECLENRGRFLDPILNLMWAICEESSWAMPAHQPELTDIRAPYIDLGVAMTALILAEVDALTATHLDPLLHNRVYDELDRRCFTPYLARHDHWWLYQDVGRAANWTAVCNGGVAGAAIYAEQDPARLADILARAAHSLASYVASFDADGGCSEGPGYWEYGFGYYTLLADLAAWRTDGAVDLLAGTQMRQIACYPLRTLLSPDSSVSFSDCDANVRFSPAILSYLAQRLDLPELASLARRQPRGHRNGNFNFVLRDLFWSLPEEVAMEERSPAESSTPIRLNRQDWFAEMMWMVARAEPDNADGLVLAAKGGHNQEMHNQNDVGSFIVHVNRESLVADLGRGRYTKAYFGSERYEHFITSSAGHSVPMPNETLQAFGPDFAATLIDHVAGDEADSLILDIAGAYPPEAGLASLRRTLTLHREAPRGWVELIDEVRFADEAGSFENALITLSPVEMGDDGGLVIHGLRGSLRVTYDPRQAEARVDRHPDVEFYRGSMDVYRIVFAWPEIKRIGAIRLELVPV